MTGNTTHFRLTMNNIGKTFPGVKALDNVCFQVLPGEIHALVGENGAGKSTLIKILSGAYTLDAGSILLEDQSIHSLSPADALRYGIITIYQETSLALHLNVAENIFMGRLPRNNAGFVRWKQLYRETENVLSKLDIKINPRDIVHDISPAQRQMVEITRAISMAAKVIVLDEPTAALTEHEVKILFQLMRQLQEHNVSVIYISHRLEEVFEICDAVTVLRDGQVISTHPIADVTPAQLIADMVGRTVDNLFPKLASPITEPVLTVENLSGKGFKNISFHVKAGEIIGLFGLVGSGRTEVVRSIFGADKIEHGTISVHGTPITVHSPEDAMRVGIVLVPEDRKSQGLAVNLSVKYNISMPNLKSFSQLGFLKKANERQMASEYVEKLSIHTPSIETLVKSLSGGNQQKVVISKWLATSPKVLILDEPTRGIDVAAKSEVHKLMSELASHGVAVLMVSSELPEIIGMSDRILVMREGRLTAELERSEASDERIMHFAAG
jgi:ribose transport system ATP-binding protein